MARLRASYWRVSTWMTAPEVSPVVMARVLPAAS